MKTSGSLPLSEGSLLGKSLLEEQIVTLTHTHSCTYTLPQTNTDAHTHAHTCCFPTEGTLDRGSPTCHCGSNYPAGSLPGPSPAGLRITNHISEHTHAHTHTLYIVMGTHVRLHTPGCAFHPQFTLRKLMARTNRNDVLAHTSCSSQEKSLRGCGRSRKRAPYTPSVIDKCIIKDETAKRSVCTYSRRRGKSINMYAKDGARKSSEIWWAALA